MNRKNEHPRKHPRNPRIFPRLDFPSPESPPHPRLFRGLVGMDFPLQINGLSTPSPESPNPRLVLPVPPWRSSPLFSRPGHCLAPAWRLPTPHPACINPHQLRQGRTAAKPKHSRRPAALVGRVKRGAPSGAGGRGGACNLAGGPRSQAYWRAGDHLVDVTRRCRS